MSGITKHPVLTCFGEVGLPTWKTSSQLVSVGNCGALGSSQADGALERRLPCEAALETARVAGSVFPWCSSQLEGNGMDFLSQRYPA